jgi:O-acetyl-ADP-ribose deacetylase (regulator of RNase III)
MKLILRDRNPELVEAWQVHFRNLPNVEIGCGDIFDIAAEAIVSPANSFGFMNGGIDGAYAARFGIGLQNRLQQYLLDHHNGELIVGEAVKIPIENDFRYYWLISAPTMRVPMDISGTVNAYLAMRAVLRLATREKMGSVLCPGLGTAIGRMDPMIAAYQMREAYRIVIENQSFDWMKGNTSEQFQMCFRNHEAMRRGFSPG